MTSVAGFASAAEYPSRAITIIVPYGAGGGVDINARTLVPYLEKYLGKDVIVENRTGSGGITGHTLGAFAKPDGYTLTMVSPGINASPYLVPGVKFTPKDFSYIGQVTFVPNFLVVNANSPWKTLDDLIKDAQAHPGELSTGRTNGWPSSDVANAIMRGTAGIDARIIPGFSGGAEKLAAILGGHLDFSVHNINEVLPHYEAGTIRILAAAAPERAAALPDVPTFRELGYDITVGVWRTLAAPAGTPQAVIDRLSEALQKALADPDLKKDFDKVGLTIDYMGPEETADYVLGEYENWGRLFKEMGITSGS